MFTGIIEEIGKVALAQPGKLVITAEDVLQGIRVGGSIAANGVCLTITNLNTNSFSVDIMPETLRLTNLGLLKAGDGVNLERPLVLGGQLGGHLVLGHVDDTGRVASIIWADETMIMRFDAPPEVMCLVVKKGFIAVDGVSLTIIDYDASSFQASIVDYTRKHTTLGNRRLGDLINLEVDIIAKYVERLTQAQSQGITLDFLQKQGFLAG